MTNDGPKSLLKPDSSQEEGAPSAPAEHENVTAEEMAARLGIRLGRLYELVRTNHPDAPPYFKTGKLIRFPCAEYAAWKAARMSWKTPTTLDGAAASEARPRLLSATSLGGETAKEHRRRRKR